MNHFLIGLADKTERLLECAGDHFLLIDDGPIADAFLTLRPKARLFDLTKHSFNPLLGIDYKRARDIAQALYTASPEGKDTLTVRNGKRALTKMLLAGPKHFDKLKAEGTGGEEALATVEDMLISPVMRQVLCRDPNFSFKGGVVVRLDRAQIGDFDAFLLGSLLQGQSKGQVIVPDGGFYMREFYSTLIRQNRLILAVNYLSELTPKLQQMSLSIKDKTVYRTSREDAERLIFYINPTGNPSVLMGDDVYETS